MRFGKLIRYGLGLSVAGGVAMTMAGSAFAADSTAAPVPQVPVPPVSQTVQPADSTVQVVTPDNSATAPDSNSQPAVSGTAGGDSTFPDVTKKPSDNNGAGARPDDKNLAQMKPGNGRVEPSVPLATGGNMPAAAAPEPAKDAGTNVVVQPPTEATPAIIVFHAAALPIQPTFTNRMSTDPSDLAAALPSAPVTKGTPVPAKSNGALGNLRVLLAGIVVPQSFMPTAGAALRGSLLAVNLLFVLLLGSLFVFTYGQWLRRGGFVNAARSDAPVAAFTSSLFATPHVLGYVMTPPRHHSPILVVADINTYVQKFSTLSERRTCI